MIVAVVDATNLERNLYLVMQLFEFGIPVVRVLVPGMEVVDHGKEGQAIFVPGARAQALLAERRSMKGQALDAAGLNYDDIRRHRYWDDQLVVEGLKSLAKSGKSLRVSDVAEENPALVAAARRRFEGWYEAVQAAGFDEDEARQGVPMNGKLEAA